MIHRSIYLRDEFPSLSSNPRLISYCLDNHFEFPYQRKRRTILVFPGGGYEFVSSREAEPIAVKFLAEDFNVFVLEYSVAPNLYFPYPFVEAFAAIAYIRHHAEEYHVDDNHIGVMGFSAGGHLAAMLAVHQNEQEYADFLQVSQADLRVDFAILGYAVTYASEDDFLCRNLGGREEQGVEYFDIPPLVRSDFPPTFIWTTCTDEVVPYSHSTRLKQALDQEGVLNEYHLYPSGKHGGSTCDCMTNSSEDAAELVDASAWIKLASDFIRDLP